MLVTPTWTCAGIRIAAFISGMRNSSTRKSAVWISLGYVCGPTLSGMMTEYWPSRAPLGIGHMVSAVPAALHLSGKS